jgi:hypothetical protein
MYVTTQASTCTLTLAYTQGTFFLKYVSLRSWLVLSFIHTVYRYCVTFDKFVGSHHFLGSMHTTLKGHHIYTLIYEPHILCHMLSSLP